MHNNIMAAVLRDCPPMLATGRYAQWQSRLMRCVALKPNGESLRKFILQGPYKLSNIITLGQPTTDESTAVPKLIIPKTFSNITPEDKAHYDAEKEAIHLLLIGIRMKFTQLLMLARQLMICGSPLKCYNKYPDTYNQAPKPHRTYAPPAKTSPSTKTYATTRHKGKEIAKPITPSFESASKEDNDPEQLRGSQVVQQTGIQCFNCKEFRHFAKEYSKPKRAKDYTYHKEKMLLCKQPEKGVPLQAQQADWLEDTDEEIDEQELEAHYSFMEKIHEVLHVELGSDAEPLEKVQYASEYNVFANERQHYVQPESINNTCVVEKVDSNVIPDSSYMCDNNNQADQNAKECHDERVVLANLIAI
nr:hypothetical protein [Tanacetum cinerariifolium]